MDSPYHQGMSIMDEINHKMNILFGKINLPWYEIRKTSEKLKSLTQQHNTKPGHRDDDSSYKNDGLASTWPTCEYQQKKIRLIFLLFTI